MFLSPTSHLFNMSLHAHFRLARAKVMTQQPILHFLTSEEQNAAFLMVLKLVALSCDKYRCCWETTWILASPFRT